MDVLHAAVALLASMVLVLAGMVGWLYWQQTRLFQNMNSMVMVIGELASSRSPILIEPAQPTDEPPRELHMKEEDEDDRASVEEEESPTEVIEGAPALDMDALETKTKKELAEILTKRGIPFGKNESKSALISLLKATA
jgi:hypothetical protein